MIGITGSTGFIGNALCTALAKRGVAYRAISRDESDLTGIQCVIHCAGIAHRSASPRDYEQVNFKATAELAQKAAYLGVRRFVFVSTAKNSTKDPYVQSKRQAEDALWQVAKKTGLEIVVVRPPLVYGPGVTANFSRLISLAQSGFPLPFAGFENKRSFISLGNLIDFLMLCAEHPNAANHMFFVSDKQDLSVSELIKIIHASLPNPRPALRLCYVPIGLLKLFASIIGFKREINILAESATVDTELATECLGWKPKLSVQEGVIETLAGQAPKLSLGYRAGKRTLDILVSLPVLTILFTPMLLIAAAIRLASKGPAIYWSERVGRNNTIFKMPKFRSMRTDTPAVATHLLTNPKAWLTPIGSFLRKTSLDELPQFWSVLKGDMSLVGPRPALYNQHDLIALRTQANVHRLRPGITGWAQVKGRDELEIPHKVALDWHYLQNASLVFDFKILLLTIDRVVRLQGVHH